MKAAQFDTKTSISWLWKYLRVRNSLEHNSVFKAVQFRLIKDRCRKISSHFVFFSSNSDLFYLYKDFKLEPFSSRRSNSTLNKKCSVRKKFFFLLLFDSNMFKDDRVWIMMLSGKLNSSNWVTLFFIERKWESTWKDEVNVVFWTDVFFIQSTRSLFLINDFRLTETNLLKTKCQELSSTNYSSVI